MMQVIPQSDCRSGQIVLVAKRAQARSAQQEIFARPGFQPKPTGGQDPEKVSARKNQNIPLDRAHALDHTIGSCTNLARRFPSWTAIAEDLPAGALAVDLRRPETLVLAIVPFHQIVVDFGLGAKAGQFAGPGRALQRTSEHASELMSSEFFPDLMCVALALVSEREIGHSCMLARESPCSLTVSCEVNNRQRFTHGFASFQSVVLKVVANR
jgi:hypothetical protein